MILTCGTGPFLIQYIAIKWKFKTTASLCGKSNLKHYGETSNALVRNLSCWRCPASVCSPRWVEAIFLSLRKCSWQCPPMCHSCIQSSITNNYKNNPWEVQNYYYMPRSTTYTVPEQTGTRHSEVTQPQLLCKAWISPCCSPCCSEPCSLYWLISFWTTIRTECQLLCSFLQSNTKCSI